MSSSSDERGPVELLADEFLARCKRGEKPTIKEYCHRYPDLADEIRDVFEAVLMVEDLKPGSGDVSDSLDDSVKVDGKRLAQVGDYRIICELGRGGMGVVYEAEQLALGRRVALKVLPRTHAGNGSSQVRFQREAKAAARMHHTNIVPVFDVGQDGDYLYYAMQLIHGQGLDQVIHDLRRLRAQSTVVRATDRAAEDRSIAASLVAGRFEKENLAVADRDDTGATAAFEGSAPSSAMLPGQSDISTATSNRWAYFRSVAQIGVQTASALSYAHGRGIIHRDIKPANLILDTTGNVWVTDFGLAKTGDGGVTHTGDILGTVRYMSPERFRGQCDVRADVYALGMTLYELLTLRAAYASGDRLKLIELIRETEAASPRSIDARIPRDLETIVIKAIDKDPRRRYQSADELAEDLQRFVNDEPIKARRPTAPERVSRWCRRNPVVAGLTAAVALLLVAITMASVAAAAHFDRLAKAATVLAGEERAAKEREAEQRQAAEDAKKLAEANFAKARAAVDDYLTKVSESRLLTVPGMQPLRRELLQAALTFYQNFIKERANDPAVRAGLAAALFRVGRIRTELGDTAEGRKDLAAALALYQDLAQSNPGDADLRAGLAQCYFRTGDYAGAIRTWDKLLAGDPGNGRYRSELAQALNSRAISSRAPVTPFEVMADHQRALDLRAAQVRDTPDRAEAWADLGQSLNNIAVRLGGNDRDHLIDTLLMYRRAADRVEPAVARAQADPNSGLVIICHNVANMERALGRTAEALAWYAKAVAAGQQLAAANPSLPSIQSRLRWEYHQLGAYQRLLGRTADAAESFRQARAVIDRLPRQTAADLYDLACILSLSSAPEDDAGMHPTADEQAERDRLADQAVDALRRAVAAGFRDLGNLKDNPDLRPVRDRQDFRAVVARLQRGPAADAPAAPAAAPVADRARADRAARADMAAGQYALGLTHLDLGGGGSRAAAALGTALELSEALAGEEPANPRYRADAALSRVALGLAEWVAGRPADGFPKWRRGLADLDALARDHPTDPVIAGQLASASLKLAEFHGRYALWAEAATHLARVVRLIPGDHWPAYQYAFLLAHAGDADDYRHHCYDLLARFGDDRNWLNAPRAAAVCLLLPGAGLDADRLARLTDLGVRLAPRGYRFGRMTFRALAAYRAGQYEAAARDLDEAARETTRPATNPNGFSDARHWFFAAMTRHRLGQADAAREALAKGREFLRASLWEGWTTQISEWHEWLACQLNLREAEALVEGRAGTAADPVGCLVRGRLFAQLGEADKADAEFRAALDGRPDDAAIRVARGRVFADVGRHDAAAADFARAIELAPADRRTWHARGRFLAGRGEVAGATDAYAHALALPPVPKLGPMAAPPDPTTDVAKADALFAGVAALRPNDGPLWLARANHLGGQRRWRDAAAALDRTLALDPADHFPWFRRMMLALELGDAAGYDRTRREFLTRVGTPDDLVTAGQAAMTHLLVPGGAVDAAALAPLVERVARAGANHAGVQHFDVIRGLAAYRAGRFAEAADLIRTGLDRPRQLPYARPAAQFVLAMTLHREGRDSEARVALAEARQSAARLTPGDDNTRTWHEWLVLETLRHEAEALLGPAVSLVAEKP
jgi:serine/threonine-protein kinase